MKRVILIAAVLSVGMSLAGWRGRFDEQFAAATASWTPAELNPIAWYKGDGNAKDAMGNYDGTWNGSEVYATGKIGQAFSFNGASQINCGAPIIGTGDFTVSFWMKAADALENRAICGQYIAGNAGRFTLATRDSGVLRFGIGAPADSLPIYSTNVVVHITTVYTAEDKTVKFFGDGTLNRSVQNNSFGVVFQGANTFIGAIASGFFRTTGSLDDVLFWNRALTATEVKKLYDESVLKNGAAW